MKTKIIGLAVVIASLGLAAVAQAHVTLQPDSVPAGGFARLDVRVPNERDQATEKVEVQLPSGFLFLSYEPVEGWTVDVKMKKLAEPVEEHGEMITEQVDTVTFTADSPEAAIQPGQFRDFGLSVGLPADAAEGDVLTFLALQAYDDGEVVRWIGDPDSEEPAPQVTLTAAEEEHGADPAHEEEESASEEAETEGDDDEDEDEGAPTWLAILGAVLGAGGLLAGGAALRRSRA